MRKGKYVAIGVVLCACLALLTQAATASPVVIHCVNTSNASCGPSYATISLAVAAAAPGDIVLVGNGTYNESVSINKARLKLLGQKNGIDARTRSTNGESIVNGNGTGTSTIIIVAQNVVVDGFTVQGGIAGNATGIDVKGGGTPGHGARIVNNIMQDNSTGLSLNSEGAAAVTRVVIEHNLFKRNNSGNTSVAGDGIFSSATTDVVIDENAFVKNSRLGIGINNSSDVAITNNTSKEDGRFVVFTGTTDSLVAHNTIQSLVNNATFLNPARAAGILMGYNNSYITITRNSVVGATSGGPHRGIQFGGYGPNPANTNLTVKYNKVAQMPVHGIIAESALLTDSVLLGNKTTGNGQHGIVMNSGGNYLSHNVSKQNGGQDCRDDTVGTETALTANVWWRNTGTTDTPSAICQP